MLWETDADLALLTEAAREAGRLAMTFFRQNPSAWAKQGGSPVTEADMAVDTLLRTRLLAARPNYGWLSEETADDPARLGCATIFVVDPIDGTRGFIDGDDRWCVSVAVVRDARPVVGVLFAPARGEFLAAVQGGGAWSGERRIGVGEHPRLAGARLTGPRGWLKSATLGAAGASLQPHVPSLAYRLAAVATGAVDAAFASPNAHDWDLAACDLLVHEAGGKLTGLDGIAPCYNRVTPLHPVLAAANARLHPKLLSLLRGVAAERVSAGLPV